MPPAAEIFVELSSAHESSTTLDVFGNDLGDVDVWGDDKPEENRESSSERDVGNADHQVLLIARRESSTETHGGVPKPPRTARQRELSAELLQKHGSVLKKTGRRSRRPSLSDSGRNNSGTSVSDSSPTSSSNLNPQLPPMTPRTRSRRLGSLTPLAPPIDTSPKVKTMSVAEKRRLRSEEKKASNIPLSLPFDDKPEQEEFTVHWTLSGTDMAKRQSQRQRSLLQELQAKAPIFGHARNHSDSQLAFLSLDLFESSEDDGFDHPCVIPGFNNSVGADTASKSPESKTLRRPRVRESRKDVKEIVVAPRSMSLPRKKCSRRNPRNVGSDHQETHSPNSQKQRSNSGTRAPPDELQQHLKSLFREYKDKDPDRGVNTKNSTHSGSTKSSRSSSRARKKKESSDDTEPSESLPTPMETEIAKPSSFSRRRREPQEVKSTPRKAQSSPAARSHPSSIPRAGAKINFVRNSSNEKTVNNITDDPDARSSGETSSRSTKSRASIKSSRSPRSGRRASLGDNYSANVSPHKRRPPACPPSPSMRNHANVIDATGRRDDDARRISRTRSPGKFRAAEGGESMTSRPSSLTPRRRIQYVRNGQGGFQTDVPSIPNLE
jgi:hypothetical protein